MLNTLFVRNINLYKSWEEYNFTEFPKIYENEQNRITTKTLSAIFISKSTFSFLIADADSGGAIFCLVSDSSQILVELSSFISCICCNTGGAIYLVNGEIITSKCCFCSCYSTTTIYSGQCLCLHACNSTSKRNYLFDSSIIHSMRNIFFESHSAPIDMRNGKIILNKVNESMNKCLYDMLYVQPSSPSLNKEEIACKLEFCSIEENEVTKHKIVYFGATEAIHEMSFSNIIDNKSPDKQLGMIYCNGKAFINNCFILDFKSFLLFYGEITLQDCFIITKLKQNEIANSKVNFGTMKYNFINEIEISSDLKGYCEASIDNINNFISKKSFKSCNKNIFINNIFIYVYTFLS